MAIKKDAGKADIGPKKQVKATFAECTAEDPLKCRYHGPKMLQAELDKLMGKGAAKVKKTKNGYEITSEDAYDAYNKVAALLPNAKGSLGLKKAVFILGDGGFVTPEGEAELEDADTLSSADAPDKKQGEADDVDNLDGSHTNEPTEEEWKEVASLFSNKDPSLFLDTIKEEMTKGTINGIPLLPPIVQYIDEEKMSQLKPDHPVKKIWEETKKKLLGDANSEEMPTDESAEPDLSEFEDIISAGIDEGIEPEKQVDEFADIIDAALDDGIVPEGEDKNGSPSISDDDIKALVALVRVSSEFLEANPEYFDFYKAVIKTGKNEDGSELWGEQKDWFNKLIDEVQNQGFDNPAAKQLLKTFGKDGGNQQQTAKPPTIDSLIADMQTVIDKIHSTGLNLTWDANKGNALGKAFEDAVNANDINAAQKALDNFKDYIHKLESGDEGTEVEGDSITAEDIKDFFKQCGIKKPSLLSDANLKATKDALETGKWQGKPLTNGNKKWYAALAKKVSGHKVANAIDAMLAADKKKPKPIKKGSAAAAILSAFGASSQTPNIPVVGVSKQKLKPLEHDESKFPQNITQAELDKALAAPSAKALGGASGDHATLITIGDKQFVCKSGSGDHAAHIHNEVMADQAYRAGGIRAPDCQEYVFEQKDKNGKVISSKTYKLAEFIEGKSLKSYMASATAAQQESLRQDLLAGFPMDVLFSNWDVIGTSRDNIIVDNEGHGWRIDNGGSFEMAAMSNKKTMKWAVENYIEKPEKDGEPPLAVFEDWDKEGGWAKRQWIDDFRTMRIDEKNKGLFDQYSTADIFLSAANIDFGNAVSGLPQGLKDALAKPLFEMRSMAHQAWCAKEAGYSTAHAMTWKDESGKTQVTPVDAMSAALDAIYEAHKDGCREWLQQKTGWGNLGWLSSSGKGSGYQKKVFPEDAPPEPLPPPIGTDLTSPILTAIISINHHIKQGDYSPNKMSLKKALELKPVLEMLASENVGKSKELLEAVQKIEDASKDGYKKQLTFNTPDGLFDANGLSLKFDSVHEAIFKKHNSKKHGEWQKKMTAYLAKKKKWDEEEERKAKAAGAAPENSFGAYEDKLIEANIDTNGVPRGGGKPQCNHDSKAAQKSTSFCTESCKKKVRQYAMMGIPLDAMYFANNDKIFYNGNTDNGGSHVSGSNTSEKDFFAAVDFYRQNPDAFRVDMESYARHKGMMALMHMNILNDAVNSDDGTVFVMREEHKQAWGKDGAGKPTGASRVIDRYPIDSSTSAQINGPGCLGDINVGWKLPIWRVSDNFMIGTKGVGAGGDGEMEICINPIQIPYPPMYFSKSDVSKGWKHCMDLYLSDPKIKGAASS